MDVQSVMQPLVSLFLVASLVWIGLATLVGIVASRRGANGGLFFLLSIFTSPIVAVLVLLILTSQNGPQGRY